MIVTLFRLTLFTALFVGVLAILNGCAAGRFLAECAKRSLECQ